MYTQIRESELIDSLQYKYSDLPYYLLTKSDAGVEDIILYGSADIYRFEFSFTRF